MPASLDLRLLGAADLIGHLGALLVILAGTAVLTGAVALLGRLLALSHPEHLRPATSPAPVAVAPTDVPAETLAILTAAVAVALGRHATIRSVAVVAPKPASVEGLMLAWAIEGRRQIYSSHRVR